MIIRLQRIFSDKKKDSKNKSEGPRDANIMTGVGKAGLQGAAGLAGIAGIETGRSLYHASKVAKDVGQLKKLKDNKVLREAIKNRILENEPLPGTGETIIEKIKWGEKNFPKFSKIDKAQKGFKWWNKASNLSRTALNNAERYTEMAVKHVKDKNGNKMTKEELQVLDKLPKTVKHAAKSGTALKNAKAIGKAGLVLGNAGALLYINGRSLQVGGNRPNNDIKKL